MKEICIPIPDFHDADIAEVQLKVGGKQLNFQFRVESFEWESDDDKHHEDELSLSLARILRLKKAIKDYDDQWELIQIYTPSDNSKNIQVLYRKKSE